MKIAVIGGGIFGVTAAWMLAKNGYSVDLFEKNKDILFAASGINQYRIHRGYHYPRSKETALSSIIGEKSFRREYGPCLMDENTRHYYCIANKDSFVTADQCLAFWDECNLTYTKVDLDVVNKEKTEVSVEVEENLFDPYKLRELCWERLKEHKVAVRLNERVQEEDMKNYDLTIIATYAGINSLLGRFPDSQKDYQFELCEKPVLKLNEKFSNKSFVVIDGPFMCIAPLGRTGLFVMGHVDHAIHKRNIGKLPVIPDKFKELLDNGIVKSPPITNIKKFIESGSEFFPDVKNADHVGSMFTIRTVPPDREHDDARPTIVEKIDEKVIVLFSGKIGTCVDAAEQVVAIANQTKKALKTI